VEFRFSDEQTMIRDTAEAFLAEVSDGSAVRAAMSTESGFDADLWRRICTEMYWQAIHIPEVYGGLGLGYVELVAVLEQMGRRLLCAPFFSTVCLGANALLWCGSDAQKQRYLPAIASGDLRATLGYHSGDAGAASRDWGAACIRTSYCNTGDGYRMNGRLRFVPDGHSAGLLVVAARREASEGDTGISLFLLPADTDGVKIRPQATMDQTRPLADVFLDNVKLDAELLMGEEGEAWPAIEQVLQLAQVGLAAEQVGVAQQSLDMSVAYTLERQQFNRPVAGFQAVKHKAADMMLKVECARSAAYYAACVAEAALTDAAPGDELAEAAAIAKACASEACFFNAGSAMQLHGGTGFTWEYDVHLYFKRARASAAYLGDADCHRERIAQQLLDTAPARSAEQ
jgi:alkylation response protein AidB-like acyl-CoA dehydrogenase